MRRAQLLLLGLVAMLLIGLGVFIRRAPQRTVDSARTDPTGTVEPRAESTSVDDQPEATAPTKPEPLAPSVAQQLEDALRTFKVHGTLRLVGTSEPLPNRKVSVTYSSRVSARARERPPGRRGFPDAVANTDSNGLYSIAVPRHVLLDAVSVGRMDGGTLQQFEQEIPLQKTLVDLNLRELSDDLELDLWARRSPTISGFVVDAETLAPVIGAVVFISNAQYWGGDTSSDRQGRFQIPPIVLAEHELHGLSIEARHPNYCSAQISMPDPGLDGSFAELRIGLTRGVVVKGLVLSPQDEPLPGVKLALRPLLGEIRTDIHEIAGSVETTSDEHGGFTLPAVREFDSAWLVVPLQLRDAFVWYGERRLQLDSSKLEDLRVHVDLQTSVEVTATFPDGAIADRSELLLACAAADGSAWAPAAGSYLACPVDRPVRVLVRSWKRALKTRSPRYLGSVTRTFELDAQNAARVQVALVIDPSCVPANADPVSGAEWDSLPPWVRPALPITVRDPATGPLLSALVNVNGGMSSASSTDGTRDVRLPPGWNVIEVGSEGHRSRWFEVFVGDRDPAPLMVDLAPLR
jgi:hypothetical protein